MEEPVLGRPQEVLEPRAVALPRRFAHRAQTAETLAAQVAAPASLHSALGRHGLGPRRSFSISRE
eukprot:5760110-Pleurochrysis_carterae.AAC.2